MEHVVIILLTLSSLSYAALPHEQCSRTYRKLGCYHANSSPLPVLLITDRDEQSPMYQGHKIDWHNFDEYTHSLACRCAAKTRAINSTVFGLQNFGECWSGPGSEKNYARDKISQDCYRNPCDVKDVQHECVGYSGVNYVYKLIEDDPCKSGPCKNGGTCSKAQHGFLCACPPNFQGTRCEHSCYSAVTDLAIVVDGSGSIGNNNYVAIKRFLLPLVDKLKVSKPTTHVALMYYSDKPHIDGKFSDEILYQDTNLMLKILGMPFPDGGETRTDLALKMANEKIFTAAEGDRPKVPDVLMVITDGKHSPNSALLKDIVKPLMDRGVRILAVAVDNAADQAGLQDIVQGKTENIFLAQHGIEKINVNHLLKAIRNSC